MAISSEKCNGRRENFCNQPPCASVLTWVNHSLRAGLLHRFPAPGRERRRVTALSHSSAGCEVERWGLGSVPPPCCLMQGVGQAVNHYTTERKQWYLGTDLYSRALCLHLVLRLCLMLTISPSPWGFLLLSQAEIVMWRHPCAREQTVWQPPITLVKAGAPKLCNFPTLHLKIHTVQQLLCFSLKWESSVQPGQKSLIWNSCGFSSFASFFYSVPWQVCEIGLWDFMK